MEITCLVTITTTCLTYKYTIGTISCYIWTFGCKEYDWVKIVFTQNNLGLLNVRSKGELAGQFGIVNGS